MLDLVEAYSITDIIIFVVMLGLAIKGAVTFFDWAYKRLKQHFSIAQEQERESESIEDHFRRDDLLLQDLVQDQKSLTQDLKLLQKSLNMLIASDKDSIKAWITDKHHFYVYEQGWIDDYNLECIEKRYGHYTDEGGNSFIGKMMEEIRALPHVPLSEDTIINK